MKTIVLDDDPTGTQCAESINVLWDVDAERVSSALRDTDAVFIQTNSRALDATQAQILLRGIRSAVADAQVDGPIRFVLRGDSTLRGHVFAETEVFAARSGVVIFVPAFPAGGRITRDGVHFVTIDGRLIPAEFTEYARDPVFSFNTSKLVDYVESRSGRSAWSIPLERVRSGGLVEEICGAPAGAVIIPDAETDADITAIAVAVRRAERRGVELTVRCAAPLAAELAGARSAGLLRREDTRYSCSLPTLVLCGSHTEGARRQLDMLDTRGERFVVDTASALRDPAAEGRRIADAVRQRPASGRVVISSSRDRDARHGTLWHGAQVSLALSAAVKELHSEVGPLIVKGGITSADIVRHGLGAESAWVKGQIAPGIALWDVLDRGEGRHPYVVVPGNVGDDGTLLEIAMRFTMNETEQQTA